MWLRHRSPPVCPHEEARRRSVASRWITTTINPMIHTKLTQLIARTVDGASAPMARWPVAIATAAVTAVSGAAR